MVSLVSILFTYLISTCIGYQHDYSPQFYASKQWERTWRQNKARTLGAPLPAMSGPIVSSNGVPAPFFTQNNNHLFSNINNHFQGNSAPFFNQQSINIPSNFHSRQSSNQVLRTLPSPMIPMSGGVPAPFFQPPPYNIHFTTPRPPPPPRIPQNRVIARPQNRVIPGRAINRRADSVQSVDWCDYWEQIGVKKAECSWRQNDAETTTMATTTRIPYPTCQYKFLQHSCIMESSCASGLLCTDVTNQQCCHPTVDQCPSPSQLGFQCRVFRPTSWCNTDAECNFKKCCATGCDYNVCM